MGLLALGELRAAHPGVAVAILSARDDPGTVRRRDTAVTVDLRPAVRAVTHLVPGAEGPADGDGGPVPERTDEPDI